MDLQIRKQKNRTSAQVITHNNTVTDTVRDGTMPRQDTIQGGTRAMTTIRREGGREMNKAILLSFFLFLVTFMLSTNDFRARRNNAEGRCR
jgi:hypothetical protein